MMVDEACQMHATTSDSMSSLADIITRSIVVATSGFGDVLRQVISVQQVLQVDVELVISQSRTVEVVIYDEPLLGSDKLVQHVCKLLAEQL